MNIPEQDLLQSISDAQITRGATRLRLITGRREIGLIAFKSKFTGQSILFTPQDLAEYVSLGARTFTEMRPNSFLETQMVQHMVDYIWRLDRYKQIQQNLQSPKDVATMARIQRRIQRSLKMCASGIARLKERPNRDQSENQVRACEASQWYSELAELAERVAPARSELERKSVVRTSGQLRLVEPLSPESIETLAEAYRKGLLTGTERTLFTKI